MPESRDQDVFDCLLLFSPKSKIRVAFCSPGHWPCLQPWRSVRQNRGIPGRFHVFGCNETIAALVWTGWIGQGALVFLKEWVP